MWAPRYSPSISRPQFHDKMLVQQVFVDSRVYFFLQFCFFHFFSFSFFPCVCIRMFNLSFYTARFPSCSWFRLFLLFLHLAVSHSVSFAFVRQTLAAFLVFPSSRTASSSPAHALFRRHISYFVDIHLLSFPFLPFPSLTFPFLSFLASRRISSSPPSPPLPLPLLHSSSSPFLVTSK